MTPRQASHSTGVIAGPSGTNRYSRPVERSKTARLIRVCPAIGTRLPASPRPASSASNTSPVTPPAR